MFKRIFIMLALVIVVLSACASAPPSSMDYADAPMAPDIEQERAAAGETAYSGSVPEARRLVVKQAELSLAVDDPAEAFDNISRLAEEMGGYVVTGRLYHTQLDSGEEASRGSITIRVPAEMLNEVLEQIKLESQKPAIDTNIDSQDVTKEYTDMRSRLRNLESAEAQLKEIMDSASKTEDVLRVYDELMRVQEQIEVIKGQIQYYEQSAAFSSVQVELLANEAVQPLTVAGWEPAGQAKTALQTLLNSLQVMANIAIWMTLFFAPLIVVLGLPIYLIVRLFKYYQRRNKQKLEASRS